MEMKFNTSTESWQSKPGVHIRVRDFGGVWAVDRLAPEEWFPSISNYYHQLIDNLRRSGFEDGRTIFAAPHDWRIGFHEKWAADTAELIEAAFQASGGRKVVIVSHSMGAPMTYEMLLRQPSEWRQKFVERWIPIGPVFTGAPLSLYALLSDALIGLPGVFGKIGAISKKLGGFWFILPNMKFQGPVVTTPERSFSSGDLVDLLDEAGLANARQVIAVARRTLFSQLGYPHPEIPVTLVFSTGNPTVVAMRFNSESDIGVLPPIPTFSNDGDGMVPLQAMTYPVDLWLKNATTAKLTSKVEYPNGPSHIPIIWFSDFIDLVIKSSCNP